MTIITDTENPPNLSNHMNKLKEVLLRHPTRSKYLLLVIDIFLVLVATKMFVNYNNIKLAIDETIVQSEYKKMELAFTENFQLPYERSEYADFFLKHENNILFSKEFIVRFQTIIPVNTTGNNEKLTNKNRFIESPQQSRKQFFYEQLLLKK